MIYWLGINGYFIRREQVKNTKKTIQLSPKEIKGCIQSLEDAMVRDQLYLKPALSLKEVVSLTGINQKTISAVLNQHLGKSFNIFINEYRVNEVKKRLLDPKNNHLTMTGIAFESGFNSQATFQRTFRQITGQSPTEFRHLHLKIFKF
jgi:AraC-like DNA-binding protein